MPHTRGVSRRPVPADALIWAVSSVLAATGLLLWRPGVALEPLSPQVWWPVLAVMFALTERFAVHLPFGRDNHSLTLNQAPLVIGLFFLSADRIVLAAVVGVAVVHLVLRRNQPIKAAFNIASTVAQVTVACVVFAGVLTLLDVPAAELTAGTWGAALAATLAADLVANVALFVIISLRLGRWDVAELARTLGTAAVGTAVVTDLALVSVLVLQDSLAALGLLAVLAVLSYALYRGFHVQRLRYSRLELLYQYTRSVDRALQDESVLETVRLEACQLLRARNASVVLCQPNSTQWWADACKGEPVLLPRGGVGPEHDSLRADGHLDGMAAPLRDGGEITGVFLVTDRLDDVSTFDREDAQAVRGAGRSRQCRPDQLGPGRAGPDGGPGDRAPLAARSADRPAEPAALPAAAGEAAAHRRVGGGSAHGRRPVQGGQRHTRPRCRRPAPARGRPSGCARLERGETVVARLGGDEFAVLLRRRRRPHRGDGRRASPATWPRPVRPRRGHARRHGLHRHRVHPARRLLGSAAAAPGRGRHVRREARLAGVARYAPEPRPLQLTPALADRRPRAAPSTSTPSSCTTSHRPTRRRAR